MSINQSLDLVFFLSVVGLTSKLEYIDTLGFDSIWLSPIYEYGGVDMGNDIIDHKKIGGIFGTEKDFDLSTLITTCNWPN